MFFSRSSLGFYDLSIHSTAIPADAVEITAEQYAALLAGQASGKQIKANAKGVPILVDPPAPTDADIGTQVRAERDARMRDFEWRYDRFLRETRLAQPTTDKLADLDAHMQALANVPEQAGFPRGVKWPVYPPVTEPKQVAAPTGGAK